MHDYHGKNKHFAPAYVADENGKPMHSWRVLLLPMLEQQALYESYDFDEPWNGPNNSRLLAQTPPSYQCPQNVWKAIKTAKSANQAIKHDRHA